MGILSWLFGGGQGSGKIKWHKSENGNPTGIHEGFRVTVFPSDGGWKYVLARADRDEAEPFFSEPYETVEAAKHEALADLEGAASRFQSITEQHRVKRKAEAVDRFRREWPDHFKRERERYAETAASVERALSAKTLKQSRLENLEKQIGTRQRATRNLAEEAVDAGADQAQIIEVEHLLDGYSALLHRVVEKKASL